MKLAFICVLNKPHIEKNFLYWIKNIFCYNKQHILNGEILELFSQDDLKKKKKVVSAVPGFIHYCAERPSQGSKGSKRMKRHKDYK